MRLRERKIMRAKRQHNAKNKKQEKVNKKDEDDREMDTETHAKKTTRGQ